MIGSSLGIKYQNHLFGIGIDIDIVILRNKTLGIGLDWKQKLVLILKWITNQDKSWYWSQLKLDIKTCLGIVIERNHQSIQVLLLVSNMMEGLTELLGECCILEWSWIDDPLWSERIVIQCVCRSLTIWIIGAVNLLIILYVKNVFFLSAFLLKVELKG